MKKLILLIIPLIACVLLSFPAAAAAERDEEEPYSRDAIVITPTGVWLFLIGGAGGIVTLWGAGGVIVSVIHKAKSPNVKQNERLDKLETDVKKINERLEQGNQRFESDANKLAGLEKSMKDSNKIIIRSLQALTAHAIDGNNIEQLRTAEQTLNDYLIEKS